MPRAVVAARLVRLAVSGGLLLGVAAFLSYGLVLLALVPAAAWRFVTARCARCCGRRSARSWWSPRSAAAGFWWFDGLAATRARYLAGIASRRPYEAFLLADLACVALVTGPAVAAGLARLRDAGLVLLVGGALAAVVVADLSGMAKGEVERIWLPFTVWLLPAAGALALRRAVAGACAGGSRRSAVLRCSCN